MARFNGSVFSTLRLEPAQEKEFTAWVVSNHIEPLEMLQEFLGQGFKVSVSYVVDQNAFCLSVIGTEATKQHKGQVMTSWSDDLTEVILIAAFKHIIVCDNGAWPIAESGSRWG
jgi:hypothetical protein